MNKSTLRSLALGFLASGILTGAYAIFFQGNVPVQGITVPSVFNSNESQHAEELAQYRDEMSSLIAERDSLELNNESLNEEVSTLAKSQTDLESEIAALELDTRSSGTSDEENGAESNESGDESENNSDDTDSTDSDTAAADTVNGTFTISEGQSSLEIASQLEANGYIESATEFQALLDEWDLNSILQAGSYDLNSDMSIHDIATELTQGAYYYYY